MPLLVSSWPLTRMKSCDTLARLLCRLGVAARSMFCRSTTPGRAGIDNVADVEDLYIRAINPASLYNISLDATPGPKYRHTSEMIEQISVRQRDRAQSFNDIVVRRYTHLSAIAEYQSR